MKIVITDPCYIENSPKAWPFINRSTIYGDWSCMCYKGDFKDAKEKSNKWDEIYFGYFSKINSLDSIEEKQKVIDEFRKKQSDWIRDNCYGEFCADSGQVAVYDYNTLSDKDKVWIYEHPWCACIVPDCQQETIEYMVDEDNNAHIIGNNFCTFQSGF